jgi:hypothetical protein
MASSEGVDGADVPTVPLPADLSPDDIATKELPSTPMAAPGGGVAPAATAPPRRTWPWVILAVLAAAAIAAVVTGLLVGNRAPTVAPSPSFSSVAPTPSASPTRHGKPTKAPPAPPVKTPAPTEPPTSAPPQPTDTPTP